MLKKLKDVGKRSKEKISSSAAKPGGHSTIRRERGKTAGAGNDLVIGGPVLVNDFSDRQLTLSAPARPMTRVDIHDLVRTHNLVEMKKHRFTAEEVNLRNAAGLTPLHVACSLDRADPEVAAYLISLGADVNAVDSDGWTPLHAACKQDESGLLIPLLVGHGADVNRPNKDGTRPLHYFARKNLNSVETLEPNAKALDVMLGAGADINATNMNGETPLHSCVMHGSLATLELLINRNADTAAVNKLGDNVLHYAVMRQRLDMVHKLLRMGLDPTASTPGGANGSPLDLAKKDSSPAGVEIAEVLTRPTIEEEEEEDAKDTDNKTELWFFVKAGDWNEVKKLREKNLITEEELRRRNAAGQSLLHLACNQAEPNREMLDYLISVNSADLNCLDNDGCSPLHYACRKNNDGESIAVLVAKGAEVSRSSNDGTKPIHYFARRAISLDTVESNTKALEFLLTYGADINALNKFGESPLHNAIMQGNLLMFQLILSKNPDLHITNNYGENILHYAIIAQKKDIVEKILDLGIDPREGPATNGTPLQQAKLLTAHPKGREVYDIVQRKATALDIAGMNEEEKRDYRRKRVIEELVETEREYANDLGIIIKVYVNPLKAFINSEEAFLSESQMEDIFGNIDEIKVVSDNMNRLLQECMSSNPQFFGKLFLSQMDELQKYEKVCTHQQIASDTLQEALNTHKSFRAFCEAGQKHRDCKKLSIDALLIKPFQRITKYPLLLRELMSVTPEDHPDHRFLVEAKEKLELLINVANEKKRVIDNKMIIKKINDNLTYRDDEEHLDLTADQSRVYKREGLLKMSFNKEKMIKRTIFLFSDLLLMCQAEKKKYTFLHYIPLSQCIVWDVTDGSIEGGKAVKNAFSVIHRVKQLRVVVCAESPESKKEWVHTLNECIAKGPSVPLLKRSDDFPAEARSNQTLPPTFKGFGIKKSQSSASDEGKAARPSSGTLSNTSVALGATDVSPTNSRLASASNDKRKGIRTTFMNIPLSSSSIGNQPAATNSSADGASTQERKAGDYNNPSHSSTNPSGGILSVLRRKTSSGERFKHMSEMSRNPATLSTYMNGESGGTQSTQTQPTESTQPAVRLAAPAPASSQSHSTPSSPSPLSSSTSSATPPSSSGGTGPKRRVRALSSYNTAPNRPLPSIPQAMITGDCPITRKEVEPTDSTQTRSTTTASASNAHALASIGAAARSLSSSSLTTSSSSVPTPAAAPAAAPPPVPSSGDHQLARALFDFEGDKEAFQIDLKEGDMVTVFERDDEKGDGWWYGECNSAIGYFPGHYVEIM